MAGKDIIRMSVKELRRLPIIQKVIGKELTQIEGADILSLCDRQIRRVVKRVREEGDKGIIHKSRGRLSNRTKPAKTKKKILELCKTRYKGFNPTFASEKLFEIDEIIIHPETLRLWFIKEGIEYKRRKGRKHRSWRERKRHYGEMIQVDGSHHRWFEDRGPECVLMAYIDDATNTVYARFYDYEGKLPAMDSFKRYIERHGIPHSIYIDRHATYKPTRKQTIEEELNNEEPLSEVGRGLMELGVEVIYAQSPQAKGRVERLFNTFQDRLIKEMRLRGIKTIKEGNKFLRHYLAVHNRRFSIKPIEEGDFHRKLAEDIDLDSIFCIKTERGLGNDFTVAHKHKLYQVLDYTTSKRVVVEERLDGKMFITYKGRRLAYKEILERPKKKEPRKERLLWNKKQYVLPKDHPYRKFTFSRRYPQRYTYEQKEKVGQKEKGLLLDYY